MRRSYCRGLHDCGHLARQRCRLGLRAEDLDIEGFYNPERIPKAPRVRSPADFEAESVA